MRGRDGGRAAAESDRARVRGCGAARLGWIRQGDGADERGIWSPNMGQTTGWASCNRISKLLFQIEK
jgi:hypothetical protein